VHVITNISLKEIEFFKKVDTYSTYQEIEMYFGNMCFPEPHINPVPDVINAESHGFDKYSFRKDPENK
jgi:hypothetical protein